jgi:hypothetical protein
VTCPRCQTVVPERSLFCLACGTRLGPPPGSGDGNGSGTPAPASPRPAESVAPTAMPAPPPPGVRQAYALSFQPVTDARLRYRIARWVVDHAPAHSLAEVQEGLRTGTFLTFLALTPEEADAAQAGIRALGVAPPFVQLGPATTAQLLLPRPSRPKPGARRPLGPREWGGLAAAVVGLVVVGLVLLRLFGGRGF